MKVEIFLCSSNFKIIFVAKTAFKSWTPWIKLSLIYICFWYTSMKRFNEKLPRRPRNNVNIYYWSNILKRNKQLKTSWTQKMWFLHTLDFNFQPLHFSRIIVFTCVVYDILKTDSRRSKFDTNFSRIIKKSCFYHHFFKY
jgi:hypothetical protein